MTQRQMLVKRRVAIVAVCTCAVVVGRVAWQLSPPVLPPGREWPVLDDVTVINPGGERRAHQTLLLRGGVIEAIRDTPGNVPARPRDRLYAGRYVLPGLIDMDLRSLPVPTHLQRMTGLSMLVNGITTVRLVGNFEGDIPALQGEIAAGTFPWPRLVACGRTLVGSRSACTRALRVPAPADAPAAVAGLAASGAGCVTVDRSLEPATLAAIRAAAAARGLPVVGDLPAGGLAGVPGAMDLRLIALARPAPPGLAAADWLRAWQGLAPGDAAAMVDAARSQSAAVTTNLMRWTWLTCAGAPPAPPPFAVFLPRFVPEVVWPAQRAATCGPAASATRPAPAPAAAAARMATLVEALHRAGVPIHPGSGAPSPEVVGGYGLWLELSHLAQAGLSPEQAWAAATRDAGAALGIPGLGTIAPGAPADLLVFRDDPTGDLRRLESLEAVIAQGRIYPALKLNRYALEYVRYFQHPLYDRPSRLLVRLAQWWDGDEPVTCEPL